MEYCESNADMEFRVEIPRNAWKIEGCGNSAINSTIQKCITR